MTRPDPAAGSSREEPRRVYRERLEARRLEFARRARQHLLVSNMRLVVFLAGAILAWLALEEDLLSPFWLAIPVLAFLGLAAAHGRILAAREAAERALLFYERGLERLGDRWVGKGDAGERFRDPEHPYAEDLDLFGGGSLFELLSTVRTAAGGETLAGWLKEPAAIPEVRARQEAVEELRGNLDLREDLAILGEAVREEVHSDLVIRWGKEPSRLPPAGLMALCRLATLAVVITVALYLFSVTGGWPPLVALGVQGLLAILLRQRNGDISAAMERPGLELAVLARILGRLEKEEFRCDLLRQLRSTLDTRGRPPSTQVARLSRLIEMMDWRRNLFFAPIAILLMWATHILYFVERWRVATGPAIERWIGAVGRIEALGALSGHAYENPADPFPELEEKGPLFEGQGLGHPFIPEGTLVRNDLCLDDERRLLVVSGSNMSGKTTLLRTVGINAVLALAGAPVRAKRLRLSPLRIGASIRVMDSIQSGHSRFYAEILRIRRVVELAESDPPALFLLDEILHGTNSHDRRIGAEGVVEGLVKRGAIGLVTTHDLALAKIVDDLGDQAANVHFEDHLEEGVMVFDYRMRPGVVRKSNALALMRAVGLKV